MTSAKEANARKIRGGPSYAHTVYNGTCTATADRPHDYQVVKV